MVQGAALGSGSRLWFWIQTVLLGPGRFCSVGSDKSGAAGLLSVVLTMGPHSRVTLSFSSLMDWSGTSVCVCVSVHVNIFGATT